MIDPFTGEEISRAELEQELKLIRQKRDQATDEQEEIKWLNLLERRKKLLTKLLKSS